jgi:hypothetical protein
MVIIIHHALIGVANVARPAAFYDAALGALNLRRVMQIPGIDGSYCWKNDIRY